MKTLVGVLNSRLDKGRERDHESEDWREEVTRDAPGRGKEPGYGEKFRA